MKIICHSYNEKMSFLLIAYMRVRTGSFFLILEKSLKKEDIYYENGTLLRVAEAMR